MSRIKQSAEETEEVPSKRKKVDKGVCFICKQNDSKKKVNKFVINER